MGIVFHRGMGVGKNTSQASSASFCATGPKCCTQQAAASLPENPIGIFGNSIWGRTGFDGGVEAG